VSGGEDGLIFVPPRRPGPRPVTCTTLRTSVRILGDAQVDMFRAMCAAAGRRPHELAADIVLEAIRAAQEDPDHQGMVKAIRLATSGLRLVRGTGPN
jgi:hypothetical protein